MPTIKKSPSELAIHGGGPPAFSTKLAAFSANAGSGHRFAELAERMFNESETAGRMVEEFEDALGRWLGVGNVIGFASSITAQRALAGALKMNGRVYLPAFGHGAFPEFQNALHIEAEQATWGISPMCLAEELRPDASAVFAVNAFGRSCMVQDLYETCDEAGVPMIFLGHQALGCKYKGEYLGVFGRAEIFELGRDQLIHATDSAVITTDDDLLAHRLRSIRALKPDGVEASMSDAAAAMAIANLEAVDDFVAANKKRYELYRKHLVGISGVRLLSPSDTYQSVVIQVDPGHAGTTRDGLHDVLLAENVGSVKPFADRTLASAPTAGKLSATLLQLPSGPAATSEAIEAVSRLVALAIVTSLESPDPIRLAA
jgi:dTDP-4-amino-4,6-dideoxygalactose transaminase